MPKKKTKTGKSKKTKKRGKQSGIANVLFLIVVSVVFVSLAYYFVSASWNYRPDEAERNQLVQIDQIPENAGNETINREQRQEPNQRTQPRETTETPPQRRQESQPATPISQPIRNQETITVPRPEPVVEPQKTIVQPVEEKKAEIVPELPAVPQQVIVPAPALPNVQQPVSTPQTSPQREREVPAPTIRDRGKLYVINPNLPKICIIVDDFGGISNTLFERFNTLDKEIAFAVLPGLSNSRYQMQRAVSSGREVLIHIPMQPENPNEALEPNTITSKMSDNEIKSQIERWMSELPLAVGINNHMGSLATQDERILNNIMMTVKQSDMFFIDSVTTPFSRAKQVAQSLNVPSGSRDIFLDVPDTSMRTARQKVEEIRRIRNKDVIIVITHCHTDVKFRQLVHFIDRLKDAGYQLIPPSLAIR
jgi:hypothetical protein